MAADWINNYVGIPFKDKGRTREGLDCWGLVRLFYQERFDLVLPSYEESYPSAVSDDLEELGRLIRGEMGPWREITEPRFGDGVLLRMVGQPVHCGIIVDPAGKKMLHIEKGIDSCIEHYDGVRWKRRVLGFYRHEQMA